MIIAYVVCILLNLAFWVWIYQGEKRCHVTLFDVLVFLFSLVGAPLFLLMVTAVFIYKSEEIVLWRKKP